MLHTILLYVNVACIDINTRIYEIVAKKIHVCIYIICSNMFIYLDVRIYVNVCKLLFDRLIYNYAISVLLQCTLLEERPV